MFQRFEINSRIVQRTGITFYGAQDKLLGREVWLWRLFEFGDAAKPDNEQLNAEKAAIRALKHPCIVTIYDIDADPDGVVAILEPATGGPIDDWMLRGPVDVQDFTQIAQSCLEALAASVAAGVPHGALESGLIFTGKSEDGSMQTSVIGFGIARLVTQLQGADHEASEALDVWTLGGILHTLLTGEHTEEGQAVRPPQEVRPEIPAPISEWVMRMLVEDVNVRPQTAADALALLKHALTPASTESSPVYQTPIPHSQWPAGYDPNFHQPVWHYPQVPVWHAPPPQWTQPYDPALAAQHPQMWQQVPFYPWPGQMQPDPYQQQLAMQQAAQQPAAPQPAEQNPNAPKPRLPVSPKKTAAADAKAEPKSVPPKIEKPKKSARRFIGPAVSLAAAAVVIWFFRDVFSPIFRRETWQGMLGENMTIRLPGDKIAPAVSKAAPAPVPVPTTERAEARTTNAVPAKPATAKPAAPPPPVPTGPIFVKKYSVPAKKGDPSFNAANGKLTMEAAPATWSGAQVVGKFTAQKPSALLAAQLPRDILLLIKPGAGIELQFDAHIDGTPAAAPRGFRFGIFDAKKGGYFAIVPVGGAGDLALFANNQGSKNLASDEEPHELKTDGNRATQGLASGKVVHCTMTLAITADRKYKIEAKVGDASASAVIDPKADPNIYNFYGGLIVLRNGENVSSFFFDNVSVEAMKP